MVDCIIEAKMEAPEYLFFIFDEDIMQQSEYDDVKEAVLFYQPKSSFLQGEDEDQMYLLFGHIVGMVQCTETLTGALPSIIRLEKSKFAVTRNTHYLLFLGYNTVTNTIPDSYAKKKLKKFLDVFAFYHGSFERHISLSKNNKEIDFVDLELISSDYLSFSQGCDVPTQSIFDPLPTITFDRTSSSIFSKAAQILESCQRRESIYCGCLFAESKIICSQISSTLVHHLLLLKANQKDQHVSVFYPGFACPIGVKILRVYLTTQEYEEIVNVSSQSPYATPRCISVNNANEKDNFKDNSKHTLGVENRGLGKTHSSSSSVISYKEEADETRSLFNMSSIASEILSSSSFASDADPQTGKELDKGNVIYTCNLSKGRSISADLLNTLNMDSLVVSDDFNEHCDVFDNTNSTSYNNLKTDRVSDKHDLPVFHLENPRNRHADNETYANDVPTSSKEEEYGYGVGNGNQVLDDMHQMHLYVQAHSDVVLVLFMEVQETYQYDSLRALWQMLLPPLGDIEAQVKTITKVPNMSKHAEKIRFVKYDNVIDKCETNMSDVISNEDRMFVNSVDTFHHQFESSSVSDITFIKGNSTYGYAHKSPFEELYLQQRGNYKPAQGPPVNSEALWRLDQQANHKLKKLLKSNILL